MYQSPSNSLLVPILDHWNSSHLYRRCTDSETLGPRHHVPRNSVVDLMFWDPAVLVFEMIMRLMVWLMPQDSGTLAIFDFWAWSVVFEVSNDEIARNVEHSTWQGYRTSQTPSSCTQKRSICDQEESMDDEEENLLSLRRLLKLWSREAGIPVYGCREWEKTTLLWPLEWIC